MSVGPRLFFSEILSDELLSSEFFSNPWCMRRHCMGCELVINIYVYTFCQTNSWHFRWRRYCGYDNSFMKFPVPHSSSEVVPRFEASAETSTSPPTPLRDTISNAINVTPQDHHSSLRQGNERMWSVSQENCCEVSMQLKEKTSPMWKILKQCAS